MATPGMASSSLRDIFVNAEGVAFGMLAPGGLFRAEHGDVIDRLEARQVVVGEHHAARLERADRGGDVLDLEAQRRVRGLGAARFREERDLGAAAAVYEFAARLGADGFEPELLAVEAPGAFDIDDRKHATDLRAFQHVAARGGCVHVVSLRVFEPGGEYLRSGQARPILGPKGTSAPYVFPRSRSSLRGVHGRRAHRRAGLEAAERHRGRSLESGELRQLGSRQAAAPGRFRSDHAQHLRPRARAPYGVQHSQSRLLRRRTGLVRRAFPRAPAGALPLEDAGRYHAPNQRLPHEFAVPANSALRRLLPLRRHRSRDGAAAVRGPALSRELRVQPQAPRFRRSRARRARPVAAAARRAVRTGAVAGAYALAADAARFARDPGWLERDRAGR